MVTARLRCRGLSPFSFIQSHFTSRFLPTFSLHTSARCTLQLSKLTRDRVINIVMLHCVYASSRGKKKKDENQQKKNSKEPDAKCIFISLFSRFPSCHSGPSLASSPTLRQGEKQSRGGERTKNKGMGESKGMVVTRTYASSNGTLPSLSLTHTHTQPLHWGLAPTRSHPMKKQSSEGCKGAWKEVAQGLVEWQNSRPLKRRN